MIVFALTIYFAKILGGFVLMHLLWDARDSKALLFKFFLGFGAGMGTSALLYFLWFWMKLPALVYPYFELTLFLFLLLMVFAREKRQKISLGFTPPTFQTLLWGVAVTLAVAFSVATFFMIALPTPHGVQDAWGIWNVSARFIYGAGERWLQIIPQNAWFHPDYPLLVSLNIAEVWSIIGANITRVPILLALSFLLGLLGLMFSALAIAKDNQQGALGVILLASAPVLASLASNQYADVPLAYFFLATGALCYIYSIRREPRLLILAGFFAGLSGWTKNEGLTFIFIALAFCLVLSLQEKKNLLKYFLAGLALPLLVIGLFKSITPANDLFTNQTASLLQFLDVPRYLTILQGMLNMFFSFGGWPVSFGGVLILYTLLMFQRPSSGGKRWLLLVLIVCQWVTYFGVYLFTPADVIVHMNTSMERLFFHLFPLVIFLVLIVLPSPREVFEKPRSSQDVSHALNH